MRNIQKTKQRQNQRTRIARSIKGIRAVSKGRNIKEALFSLSQIAKNYPKIKA